jgi:hypothetical protein
MGALISHLRLPEGTILGIVTKNGTALELRLLHGTFCGHSRPVAWRGKDPDEPRWGYERYMTVVPAEVAPGVGAMEVAYAYALTAVSEGNVVYLAPHNGGLGGHIDTFTVRSVVVKA